MDHTCTNGFGDAFSFDKELILCEFLKQEYPPIASELMITRAVWDKLASGSVKVRECKSLGIRVIIDDSLPEGEVWGKINGKWQPLRAIGGEN